jgi:subtilisin family serine protease
MKQILSLCFLFWGLYANAQLMNPKAAQAFVLSDVYSQSVQHHLQQIHAVIIVDTDFEIRDLMKHGVVVQTNLHPIYTLLIPSNKLSSVFALNGIIAIELPTTANSMRMQMDSARALLGIDAIHKGIAPLINQPFEGDGVVVGIVDIGFQHKHPAFLADDSTSLRISRMWQQNDAAGPAPNGYSYGTEYIGKQEIYKDVDFHGTHGTHVAGIAAGSGIGSPNKKFKGIAPNAELVFVSIKFYNQDIPGSALSDYIIANPAIIDAYAYIFDYAKSVGKPAVINLSWGMHTGPHDGTSVFDLATNKLVGQGAILVGAAGNYGQNPMHIDFLLQNDTAKTLAIENQRNNFQEEQVYIDIWGSGNSSFSMQVQVMDTLGNVVYQTPFFNTKKSETVKFNFNIDSSQFAIDAVINSFYQHNQKPNILLWLTNPQPQNYVASLVFTSSFSQIHAWNSGGIYRYTSGQFVNKWKNMDLSSTHTAGNTNYTVGENGGTSPSVISVGASVAKNFYVGIFGDTFNNQSYAGIGQIAPFSSKGPTADGRIKPDILAPGLDVAAPIYLQQYPGWAWNRLVAREGFGEGTDTFAYGVFSGTSMAAPQVAGTVALMLQANPLLNNHQIRNILSQTALVDLHTGNVPNNNAGWGKLNPQSAIFEALRILNNKHFNSISNKVIAFPNPTNEMVTIESPVGFNTQLVITNALGLKVYATDLSQNQTSYSLTLNGYAPGIYLLNVNNQVLRLLVTGN